MLSFISRRKPVMMLQQAINENNIQIIIYYTRSGTDAQKEDAAMALGKLASNADNRIAIIKAGGIGPLVTLVRDGTDEQKKYAAMALSSLGKVPETFISDAGGLPPLVALVESGTDVQKEKAAEALWKLASNVVNQVAIRKAGGIRPLVNALTSPTVTAEASP